MFLGIFTSLLWSAYVQLQSDFLVGYLSFSYWFLEVGDWLDMGTMEIERIKSHTWSSGLHKWGDRGAWEHQGDSARWGCWVQVGWRLGLQPLGPCHVPLPSHTWGLGPQWASGLGRPQTSSIRDLHSQTTNSERVHTKCPNLCWAVRTQQWTHRQGPASGELILRGSRQSK